jgi:dUTP pyrophosphatase
MSGGAAAEVTVAIRRLSHGADLPLPAYATSGSAGLDLRAAVAAPVEIPPGQWRLLPTGLALALPEDFEAQIRPRSGLALEAGVTVLNSPGTIDCDYRGEIGVILVNHGSAPFVVGRGDRIAQLIVAPVVRASWREVTVLDDSERAAGGFGSTG